MAVSALAEAPFMPVANAPDHVVIMTTQSFGRESGRRTHTHHGGWTRVDEIERGRPATRYFGHAESILVQMARDASDASSSFSVRRGDEIVTYLNRDRFKTGETRTILGETCHVWNVQRATNINLVWLSCVTDDGIELWRAAVGVSGYISASTATRIERRAVAPGDVRPPVEALDLRAWNEAPDLTGKTPPGSPGDYEVVIEPLSEGGIHSAGLTRIVRRHHPWISIDDRRADGQRNLTVRNEASGLSIAIETDPKIGLHQVRIYKFPPPPADQAKSLGAATPVALDRSETVLGETCRWFDVMPNASDAGLHECRTADGIVLKELRITRGTHLPSVATRLTRRPVALTEVLPPADMLAPRSWGLPE
jgi:hypothetical protein